MKTELAAQMRAAWEAGFSVVPAGAGKRPTIEWKRYIEQRCELDQLLIWLAEDHEAFAILGGGPERLVVFDFEAAFDFHAFAELLRDADLFDVFELWTSEFWVRTPSGGMHVYVRLMGDDPVPGNTKLSFDSSGKVTAETRGDRGLVIGPGSNGRTHPNGGLWMPAGSVGFDGVRFVEREHFDAVCGVIATMSEAPLAPVDRGNLPAAGAIPSTGGVSLAELERGSSVIPAVKAAIGEMRDVLHRYGYVVNPRDPKQWRRPGKTDDGYSCTITAADRLCMFSSNDRVPMSVGSPPRTFDVIEVVAFNEGVSEAEVIDRFRPAWTPPVSGIQSTSLVLPGEFWSARPYLQHIFDAAHARRLSPELVWEAFKAMYASTIPWTFRLPDDGTLDYVSVMVGDSGSGKTQAKKAAGALLPVAVFEIEGINPLLPAPASGEGIAEWYMDRSKGAADGALANRGGCFYVDEGQAMFDLAGRPGNIMLQTIKSAFSGELTGSIAATGDRRRVIQPMAVRFAGLVSIQIAAAAQFLRADRTAGGLPQRISWGWAHNPNIPEVRSEWPGRLDVPVYDYHRWGGGDSATLLHEIRVDASVLAGIDARTVARRREPGQGSLDVHADYATLKTAAILALLDDRREVQVEDWILASQDWDSGVAVRQHVLTQVAESRSSENQAIGISIAERNIAAANVYLERAIDALVRKVSHRETPLPSSEAKDHLRSYKKRHGLGYREILDVAAARGKVVVHSNGAVSRG